MPELPMPQPSGMIGFFWVVDVDGRATVLMFGKSLSEAVPYADMLTIEEGHHDYWAELARRGSHKLRTAGLPTAPAWSEYDEWPRGRVVFNQTTGRFILYADPALHDAAFVHLITGAFALPPDRMSVQSDPHYQRSTRVVSRPAPE